MNQVVDWRVTIQGEVDYLQGLGETITWRDLSQTEQYLRLTFVGPLLPCTQITLGRSPDNTRLFFVVWADTEQYPLVWEVPVPKDLRSIPVVSRGE